MRAVVQRVTQASVTVVDQLFSQIGKGYLVLLCVMEGDGDADAAYMVKKLMGLRVFEDENGRMNRSITDVGGEFLIVSQFTLAGDARHGNRPSFIQSAAPELGQALYERVCAQIAAQGIFVKTGVFAADMQVSLVNDGPVTILLDSGKLF